MMYVTPNVIARGSVLSGYIILIPGDIVERLWPLIGAILGHYDTVDMPEYSR